MSEHDNAVLPARTAANPYSGEIAIEARYLVKTYPGPRGGAPVQALDQLSIRVAAGTIFGLLGPNGAGKSTTVKILTTLSRPDSGDVRVAGIDVMITHGVFLRAAFRYETIGYTFKGTGALGKGRDGEPMGLDVPGARDSYIGGMATVGYVY
jgi:ABC-type glutathione transport system ATPase component